MTRQEVRLKPDTTYDGALDAQWHAVLARDTSADGAFVYGVSSTGIYCRPSCPSRRPRRERVGFFATAADAERAGFRPCRRCHPDETAVANPWAEKIRRSCLYLANADGSTSLATLAARVGGSPYHLQRNFKRIVGVTPREYAEACKLRRVRRALHKGGAVTDAMFDAGYGSSGRFYERAASKLGMTPLAYQKGGAGMAVRYAIADCALGKVLAATTERGLCAVSLGSSDVALVRALTAEYPRAAIVEDRRVLKDTITQIVAHLAGRQPRLDLPIDVQATAFQWQVWKALAAIPYGETRSYGDVAKAIGRPNAFRAVARACATNPVAIVIPCHRVVPTAGGVGGYRWGPARKTALLADERQRRSRS